MKQKRIFALLLAFCLLLALPACKEKESSEESDDSSESESIAEDENFPAEIGDTHLRKAPGAVISISPGITAIIGDLGYGDKLVGVSNYCAEGNSSVETLAKIGTVNAPDLSAIKDLAPDVLVTASPLSKADLTKIQQMNIDVIVLPRAKTLDELETLYTNLGKVFEGETAGAAKGKELYAAQRARLDEMRSQVDAATVNSQRKVAYLRMMPLTLATGDTFEGKLLEEIGFANSAAEYGEWAYPQDKSAALMPDMIFYDKAIGADALKNSEIYNTTPAYKNSKCFEYDMEVFERQGVAMIDMLEQMVQQAIG